MIFVFIIPEFLVHDFSKQAFDKLLDLYPFFFLKDATSGLKQKNLSKSPYSFRIKENTDQKKLRIWTLFT